MNTELTIIQLLKIFSNSMIIRRNIRISLNWMVLNLSLLNIIILRFKI